MDALAPARRAPRGRAVLARRPAQPRARVRRRVERRRRASPSSAPALGLVGHTHVAAACEQTPRGARAAPIRPGEPLDLAGGKWLLNPGAVGAPVPPRLGWWDGLDAQAAEGAFWLLLDLERAHRDLAARAVRPGPGARARAGARPRRLRPRLRVASIDMRRERVFFIAADPPPTQPPLTLPADDQPPRDSAAG